jgi:excisionase family DNA binding protein
MTNTCTTYVTSFNPPSYSESNVEPNCLTVSVPHAGRLLGYSRNTAYEAIRRGEIPAILIGRKIRVPLAAPERMLSSAEAVWRDRQPAAV